MRSFFHALFLLVPSLVSATQFYVSPDGLPANDGSINSPWNLQTALDHPAVVLPGDTIWLRGGTYFGNPVADDTWVAGFISTLEGTADKPILIRQYPGERAILDGGNRPHPVVSANPNLDSFVLGILGDYTTWWGFEVTDSNTHSRADSMAGFRWRVRSLVTIGTGIRLINLTVHDTGNGLGPFSGCVACEVYGNLIFYNGWSHLGVRGHGEGMYGQNVAPTKFIRDNIVFKQFDSGIIFYGSANSTIDNLHFEGNVVFANGEVNDDPNGWGFLLGKSSPVTGPGNNFIIKNNFLYNRFNYNRSNNIDMGYQSGLNNVSFKNNYSAGYWSVRNNLPVTNLSASGNTLIGGIYPVSAAQISPDSNLILPPVPLPTENAVFVRPNIYEQGRSHIIVYNWLNLNELSVSLVNSGLIPGDHFEIVDVQNLFGPPVVSGIFQAANPTVNLPMNLTEVTTVVGENVPKPAVHTDPVFNVFLVRKTGESVAAAEILPYLFSYFMDDATHELHLNMKKTGNWRAEIWDFSGRLLFRQTFSEMEKTFDLSALPAGIHALSVFDSQSFGSSKLWLK